MKHRLWIFIGLGMLGLVLGYGLERARLPLGPPEIAWDRLDKLAEINQDAIYRLAGRRDWDGAKAQARTLLEIRSEGLELARVSGSQRLLHRALGRLGRAHHMNGDFESAYDTYHEAIQAAPEGEERQQYRAELFILCVDFGEWEKAEQTMRDRLAQEPDKLGRLSLQLEQASICRRKGELEAAEAIFDELTLRLAQATTERELRLLSEIYELGITLAWEREDREAVRDFRIKSLQCRLAATALEEK